MQIPLLLPKVDGNPAPILPWYFNMMCMLYIKQLGTESNGPTIIFWKQSLDFQCLGFQRSQGSQRKLVDMCMHLRAPAFCYYCCFAFFFFFFYREIHTLYVMMEKAFYRNISTLNGIVGEALNL